MRSIITAKSPHSAGPQPFLIGNSEEFIETVIALDVQEEEKVQQQQHSNISVYAGKTRLF